MNKRILLNSFKLPDIEIPVKAVAEFPKVYGLSNNTNIVFKCDTDGNMVNKLCGSEIVPSSAKCSLEFDTPYMCQNRKHRKKRINKKWAKHYGYTEKFKHIRMADITIPNTEMSDYVTFSANNFMTV